MSCGHGFITTARESNPATALSRVAQLHWEAVLYLRDALNDLVGVR